MNTNHKFAIERIEIAYKKQPAEKIKYIALYKTIKQCILKIELPNGWLLPSTRLLSEELHISRTSVLKAYDLLTLEKLISPKAGSGNKIIYTPETNDIVKKSEKSVPSIFNYPEISEKGISYLKKYFFN